MKIKEIINEVFKFRINNIIRTSKGSGKIVRIFRNKIQVRFESGNDIVFDVEELKPLNEEIKISNVLLKKLIKAADAGHIVDGRTWKSGEYKEYLEKLAKEKKVI